MIILIGTKSDETHAISTEEGLAMMKKIGGMFYVETSAETGQQIDEVPKFILSYSTKLPNLCIRSIRSLMNSESLLSLENTTNLLF